MPLLNLLTLLQVVDLLHHYPIWEAVLIVFIWRLSQPSSPNGKEGDRH